ncbi:MAG: kelch repeat-containing protein [Bacteroidales bacterium]
MARNNFILTPLIVLLFSLSVATAEAQQTGLRFAGSGVPLDNRTGLNLTPEKPITFDSDITLAFNLKFIPNQPSYFGFIFRTIIENQNIDLIYSSESTEENNFQLIIGSEVSNISFPYPVANLTNDWVPVELVIKKRSGKIMLKLGDTIYKDSYESKEGKSDMYLFFGAHRFGRFSSTDLPNMIIRNITFSQNGQNKYSWPLDQQSGKEVKEVIHQYNGKVDNPHWILNLYSTWVEIAEFNLPGRILYAYDSKNQKIRLIQEDSLYSFDLLNRTLSSLPLKGSFAPDNRFNFLYDNSNNQFILYSIGLNFKYKLPERALIEINIPQSSIQTIYWHHCSFLHPENGQLYTFGGYGQYTYLNNVFVFKESKKQWDTVKYEGIFHPRYLAGLGYNPRNDKVYIIGGFGSKSGKQTISPGYYYDLIAYSFEENRFETLHKFPEKIGAFCFAKSLVIDTVKNVLIGLKFSKFETTSEVQAVALSLEDYSLEYVGNNFYFEFLDINSNIDLFCDQLNKRLYAFTTYLQNGKTKINIYQIAYPPIQVSVSPEEVETGSNGVWLFVLIILLLLSAPVIYLLRRKKLNNSTTNKSNDSNTLNPETVGVDATQATSQKPGAIFVFGGFRVTNKNGKDITNSFTPLLKEMFLYILLSSIRHNKGISSKSLNEVFWLDKSEQAARNNRYVNIRRLKTLLESVGQCHISKDSGYWKFEFDPSNIYIDLYEYMDLLKTSKLKTKQGIQSLLKIIHLGPAMQNVHGEWLDTYKLEISNEVIDHILEFITREGKDTEAELIIQLADAVFHFDQVSEEAMIIKCKTLAGLGKHGLATNAYKKFVNDYKSLYNEDFPKSLNQILEEKVPYYFR